ncbi:MAG: CapA family protein [Candidatus Pacebacteria bacterium]|nr:CapA family protein [Candidatus Paceibacterota bacterium]
MLKIASFIAGFLLAFSSKEVIYVAPELPKSDPVTIVMVGDMMFDRHVRKLMDANGIDYPFEKIHFDADIVVGNLEGTITENQSVAKNDVLRFTFDPKVADLLKKNNFTAVSLANNHTRDFGYKGYTTTIDFLTKAGIGYFGDWENYDNLSYIKEVKGKKIEFIGFNEFGYRNFERVLSTVASSTADYIIVFPHWGVEYEKQPSTLQKTWAHKFIDAGADTVIGAHPHITQTIEWYKEKPIVYSMGNFIFDQYANDDLKTGSMVKITLDETPVYEFIDIYAERSQPAIK